MEKYRDLEIITDCLFPSDNDAEIPTLDLSMQALSADIPFLAFGEQRRTFNLNHTGSLHFYVDDYRFNAVYEHPERILQHNPLNIVEPNFSLYAETPIAFGLQAIYKKRWIARAMQERGVRVFVDLNVNEKFYKMNMLGVPEGWRAFATRGYSDRLNSLKYEYMIAQHWAGGKKPIFVIYGGGRACRDFAKANGCIYINPVIKVKNQLRAMQRIEEEGVAFLGEEFSVKRLEQEIISKQVEAFPTAQIENKRKITKANKGGKTS